MGKVEVEEGSWIIISDSNGKQKLGQVRRKDIDKPFSEKNLAIYIKGEGTSWLRLEEIIRVYPKVTVKENPKDINPSKRDDNESK